MTFVILSSVANALTAPIFAQPCHPLKAGMIVSTGAATGIHDIRAGQSARLVFDGIAELRAHALPALPHALGGTP